MVETGSRLRHTAVSPACFACWRCLLVSSDSICRSQSTVTNSRTGCATIASLIVPHMADAVAPAIRRLHHHAHRRSECRNDRRNNSRSHSGSQTQAAPHSSFPCLFRSLAVPVCLLAPSHCVELPNRLRHHRSTHRFRLLLPTWLKLWLLLRLTPSSPEPKAQAKCGNKRRNSSRSRSGSQTQAAPHSSFL